MKIYAPMGCSSASWQGMPLVIEADGSCEIPAQGAEDMLAHGFSMTPSAPVTPLTKKEQSLADKVKAEAKVLYDEAVAFAKAAHEKLLDLEGRGDAEAVLAAIAVHKDAQEAVKKLEAAL